jgi:hypothetical protein
LWLAVVVVQGIEGAVLVLVVLELQQDFRFHQGLDIQSQLVLVVRAGYVIATRAEATLFLAP